MTYSKLTKEILPAHGKFSSRKGQKIFRIIFHHWAGTAGGDARLMNPKEAASANYLIYNNGDLKGQVSEKYRAWTSGSFAADGGSITVEMQNQTRGPEWRVSDAAINTAIKLLEDVARRYGWGDIQASNVRGHFEFQATACPGPYVKPRLGDIREKARALLLGAPTKPTTKPKVEGKTVSQLADEVLRGLHGSGDKRKKSLGSRYAEVQAEVNRRITGSSKPSEKPSKSIEELAREVIAGKHGHGADRAKSLGAKYNAVQSEVNRQLNAKSDPKPAKVDVARLAKAVIRGDYGSGNKRKKALGANYGAVQAEVNKILSGQKSSSSQSKSISQLAQEVIEGKHGSGEDRKKSLGSKYAEVQKEVNRRLQ